MTQTAAMSVDQMAQMVGNLDQPSVEVAQPAPAPGAPAQPTEHGLRVFVDADQLKKDLQVNPNDLDDAVISQAPMFVHYAQQAAYARRQWEKCKLAADVMESTLDSAWRKKFVQDGVKATEKMIENAVKSDPRMIAAQTKVIEARSLYDIANDAREAYMMRKDMIVQVSVDRRREREGQLRIMSAREAENAANSARDRALAAEQSRLNAA
ncbi:hypothetical protein [Burkholderia vietnamiensis]|uniref:hypothetical protein n=1 Tax=Burkholderia vietnamiensis TaxID=60552 RepID=UPI001CB5F84C|nr:hypothetical protein [Burkholderia vietnamiensis]CAG9229093.1 conserved hypothetical protein [Burkholderia vietnamiensis]